MKNALILCSGGLDSVTTAYYVKNKLGYKQMTVLFFDYMQRNINMERKCSKICAKDIRAEFIEIKLNWLGKISTSMLNSDKKAKMIEKKDLKDSKKESEKWYVPCRNSLFLIYALALVESIFIKEKKKYDIFVGFKCEGKESYPDTTKGYIELMNQLSKNGCNEEFKIFAPLIEMDKEDIVLMGKELGIDYKKTFSCYTGKEKHCGTCLACKLRQEGFYWANVDDPTNYKKKS